MVIYDDGHGMVKDMLTVAVTWGGTHRQGSRKGFGKYGYGLPSASLVLQKNTLSTQKLKVGIGIKLYLILLNLKHLKTKLG